MTTTAAGACPPDRMFARLLDGELGEAEVRALQAHGDACRACARTLAELARSLTPDAPAAAGEDAWLGGRYRLLAPLGAGGMGVVYTAFDTKLHRKVAIKRLRAGTASPADPHPDRPASDRRRARFLREAQLLASLSHPNVLTVHDVGGGDRELYVVTELVDGWPMSRWISEAGARPGWRQIVDLYLQVGRGLAAAHRLDVVHRDVKPENILVARSGRVLIGDFGLAGLAGAGEAPAGRPGATGSLTETGTMLGTPAYMAPELHDRKPADARSDQFSFCVSLYESLHGRRPFTGQTAAEIAAAARAARLPPERHGVPRAVDRVLATGLCADPRRRHPSMDDLLARLARARERPALRPGLVAAGLALLAAAGAAAVTRSGPPAPVARAAALPAAAGAQIPPEPDLPEELAPGPPAARAEPAPAAPPAPARRRLARVEAGSGAARARSDPATLLYLADTAHADRDGAACQAALDRVPPGGWPPSLAERAVRRRATCAMLRGSCDEGRRLLEPLDGPEGARRAELDDCPASALGTVEDRLLAVAAQADEARYAGNQPARRRELRQVLLRQAASPEMQACLRDRGARGCGRRLPILARAYQVLAEAYLTAGDCREGAALDVAQSQVRFASLEPEGSDPALGCRAQRTVDVYSACAAAAEEAERRCLARAR
jgi:hypothetical protein